MKLSSLMISRCDLDSKIHHHTGWNMPSWISHEKCTRWNSDIFLTFV